MNSKTLYSIIAIVIILIVGAFVYMQSTDETSEQANNETTNQKSTETSPDSTDSTPQTPTPGTNSDGTFSGETDVTNVDVAVYDIAFDGKAYTPANVTIKNGDIVRFKNNSDEAFWPASARHPDHLEYPEFDPKNGVAAGGNWEFKFTKTGKWGFHDHLTPSAFGSVTVQ